MNSTRRRSTWQRIAVREALSASEDFVAAQTLHQRMRQDGSTIGVATVYRALADLVEQVEADTIQSPDGEALYRACSPGHHHHLICLNCGLTVEIEAGAVEQWAERVAEANGFTQPAHVVDVFGRCASCTHTTT